MRYNKTKIINLLFAVFIGLFFAITSKTMAAWQIQNADIHLLL